MIKESWNQRVTVKLAIIDSISASYESHESTHVDANSSNPNPIFREPKDHVQESSQ